MPMIVSVCNLKGGAGKSTIAVNFACAIQHHTSETCALVDADRQGTAQAWGASGRLPIKIFPMALAEAKAEDRYPGMIWMSQIKELATKYGFLVIDLPAGLQYSLAAVTAISDIILVPVNPSGLDFHSTKQFIDLIWKSRELRGTGRPDCVIVPNRIDARTGIARDLSPYRQFGERMAQPIHVRKAFSDAFDSGQWAGSLAPESVSHREIKQLVEFIRDPLENSSTDGRKGAAPPAA